MSRRTFIEGIALLVFEFNINPLPYKRYKVAIWRTRRGRMVTEILDGNRRVTIAPTRVRDMEPRYWEVKGEIQVR